MAGVRQARDESATQYVDFAVDRRRSVAYGVEVVVKLYLVVVKLRLLFWVQVLLAAYVGESASLSERDDDVVDTEGDRGVAGC